MNPYSPNDLFMSLHGIPLKSIRGLKCYFDATHFITSGIFAAHDFSPLAAPFASLIVGIAGSIPAQYDIFSFDFLWPDSIILSKLLASPFFSPS